MRTNTRLLFLVVGLLSACVDYVNTCSCFYPEPLRNGCNSRYSLRGVVLSVRYVQGPYTEEREYWVRVQRYYKAIPRRPRFVRIRSARDSATCGVLLQRGQRYVISEAQPMEREICGQLEAISFGDTTCEVCVEENGIYKDFVVEIALIREQMQKYGDISEFSSTEMEEIIVERLPFPVKLHAMGMNVLRVEL